MAERIPVPVPRVYALVDPEALDEPARLEDAVDAMADAGVRWIQLRAKKASASQVCVWLETVCRRLEDRGCRLWVDDRADLAAIFPVAGVHLGQRDLPVAEARKLLGETRWIGQSTHDRSQVLAAVEEDCADLIAVGPVFSTRSKAKPDPVVGLELVRWTKPRVGRPLVAIGGIDAENLPRVLAAGADTVAVLGAACRGDVYRNCRRLVDAAEAA